MFYVIFELLPALVIMYVLRVHCTNWGYLFFSLCKICFQAHGYSINELFPIIIFLLNSSNDFVFLLYADKCQKNFWPYEQGIIKAWLYTKTVTLKHLQFSKLISKSITMLCFVVSFGCSVSSRDSCWVCGHRWTIQIYLLVLYIWSLLFVIDFHVFRKIKNMK